MLQSTCSLRRATAAGLLLLTALASLAWSAPAGPAPAGPVVLEVKGRITAGGGQPARFDQAALERLPREEIETSTPWTTGKQRFAGVRLEALMKAVGAQGSEVAAVALNDYRVVIPLQEAIRDGALVAYELNGAPFPVRSRGPLWIVFPFDQTPRLRGEQILSRSIWQLKLLEVR